jgi:hypothetical protein
VNVENAASNNDQCNGIYVFSARSCIKFPSKSAPRKTPAPVVSHDVQGTPAPHVVDPIKERSKSPSAIPLYNVSSYKHATCEQVNTRNQPCIPVQSWTDFRDKVEDVSTFDGQTLIFCPFTITRGSLVPVVYITSSVNIVCSVPRQCRLISNSRHFMIHAFQGAKLYMQGFVLDGASDISVQFLKDNYPNNDPIMHRLCNVEFIRYVFMHHYPLDFLSLQHSSTTAFSFPLTIRKEIKVQVVEQLFPLKKETQSSLLNAIFRITNQPMLAGPSSTRAQ